VETKIETTLKTVETKLKTSETNKNDKNDKNEIMKEKKKIKKKSFSPPTQSEVCKYFSENGYKKEIGDKAFSFYNIAGWKDSRGNQVNNWKQKMISVWFKEENKINNINQKINNRNLTRSEQNAMECQKFIEGAGNEK